MNNGLPGLPSPLPTNGMEIHVARELPFMSHDSEGKELGLQHWVPMFDKIFVSRELWDWLKVNVREA